MNSTKKLALVFLLFIGGVLTLVTAVARSRREPPVTMGPLSTRKVASSLPSDFLTEYTLTQQGGQEFHSADMTGTPHVVNFFFASCPSYCRMQSMEVQKLVEKFGPDGVVFLSITCDPDNDTPAALTSYADRFNADQRQWKFLTGDMLLLRRIGAEIYGVPVDTQTHSEHLVVIDKWGQPRGRFRWRNHPHELGELTELLPKLLLETEPPVESPKKTAFVIDEETGRLVAPGDQSEETKPQVESPARAESPVQTEAEAETEAETEEVPVDEATTAPIPESNNGTSPSRADS
jgi:cytochrome oxidase Cu insertion factor (SCO1/SenC/PrrC family)